MRWDGDTEADRRRAYGLRMLAYKHRDRVKGHDQFAQDCLADSHELTRSATLSDRVGRRVGTIDWHLFLRGQDRSEGC